MNDPSVEVSCAETMELAGRLYPDGRYTTVRIEGEKVAAACTSESPTTGPDAERWLVPGFFDLQVNGFAGKSLVDHDVTVEDVEHVARAVFRTGVTRFLPTVVTAGLDIMCRQLSVIADAMENSPLVRAMSPGIHVEGPFIHPEDGPRGAHPRSAVRDPNLEDYQKLSDAARGRIALLTLAPERPGGLELIRHAVGQGVIVALGHHRAGTEALEAAVQAGARMATHLGNGSDSMLPRHPNYIWEQLGDDRLWASFITDGHHLPSKVMRSMLRAKTVARSLLVTDAIMAAGMPAGRYQLGDTSVERTETGKIVLPGTPYLAGSGADMPLLIGRAVIDGGVSLLDAVNMASIRPSMLMPDAGPVWSCGSGATANLVELEWQPQAGRVLIRQVAAWGFSAFVQPPA